MSPAADKTVLFLRVFTLFGLSGFLPDHSEVSSVQSNVLAKLLHLYIRYVMSG